MSEFSCVPTSSTPCTWQIISWFVHFFTIFFLYFLIFNLLFSYCPCTVCSSMYANSEIRSFMHSKAKGKNCLLCLSISGIGMICPIIVWIGLYFWYSSRISYLVDLLGLGIAKQTNGVKNFAWTVKLSKHDKEITRVGSYIRTVKVSSWECLFSLRSQVLCCQQVLKIKYIYLIVRIKRKALKSFSAAPFSTSY